MTKNELYFGGRIEAACFLKGFLKDIAKAGNAAQ